LEIDLTKHRNTAGDTKTMHGIVTSRRRGSNMEPPMMRTRPKTARHFVVEILRTDILRGHYPTGSRLRQEEVAARLGVSTTPVREAFRDLLAEGMIQFDTHRGAIVRGLTLSDLREIYEMRILLEPMLAARAVVLATNEQLARADELHAQLCNELDPERWAALNIVFHQALNAACSNSRLARHVNSLAEAAASYVSLSMHASSELMQINNADHEELLELYRLRDIDGVRVKTAAHLEQTLQFIDRRAQVQSELQSAGDCAQNAFTEASAILPGTAG
jgi:DNA-binding GntR family transcriptional regulator